MNTHDPTRLGGIGEIAESEATGSLALAYDLLQTALGVNLVPTIYRMLATHRDVCVMAVERLAPFLKAQRDLDFVLKLERVAREANVNSDAEWNIEFDASTSLLIDKYSSVNPLNLLFALGLLGTDVVEQQSVMSPPLPSRSGDIWDDILACHGGVVIPGFWRELGKRPDLLEVVWSATRAQAQIGGFDPAREALLRSAVETVTNAGIDAVLNHVDPGEAKDIRAMLKWFPIGITTMIAEVAWIKPRTNTDSS